MEIEQQIYYYDMLKQVNEWCEQNQELIMQCMMMVTHTPSSGGEVPTCQTVRQYQKRSGPIKATEHERAKSRAYYIANRAAILEKRRLHNLKIKRYEKNLKSKAYPMKS
jgi:hypothetical protein